MNLAAGLKRLMLGPETKPIPNLNRNDRCWCGSGKKYKICHQSDDDRRRSAERAATATRRTSSLKRGF
jgi:uncharacterized protein YecA (UPF0149 family)